MASDQLYVVDGAGWRGWLAGHHADRNLIWLVFEKKDSGEPTIAYEAAVEEALAVRGIMAAAADRQVPVGYDQRKPPAVAQYG